ncbi:MAG: SBBP repeat-containing protein, partial [Bacteroidetes bacterium]|nr:SBBP repeat-containing protein [Bacteroidota bacterium]
MKTKKTLTALVTALSFTASLAQTVNLQWAKQFGGASIDDGVSITVDASGNVYTTGSFEGTADFDPGAATFNMTSAGNWDIFLSKLDSSGNFLWAKKIGSNVFNFGDKG